MKTEIIRGKLHEYIERADDEHLAAMYVLLCNEINSGYPYDEKTLGMLYDRVEKDLKGLSKSYSSSEALSYIRSHRSGG